jgi:peptidoglycan hydrolase-like protein with peptidoglycan-binding domain
MSPWIVVLAIVLLAAAGGIAYTLKTTHTSTVRCGKGVTCSGASRNSSNPATDVSDHSFKMLSSSPSNGATGVASTATVTLKFSAHVDTGSATPTISPAIAGGWTRSGDVLTFGPDGPFVPYQKYTITVPGGSKGVRSTTGAHLTATETLSFTIADGNTTRLQQLLAELGYLPLAYSSPTPTPRDLATPQPGTLSWRWSGLPSQLTGQWVQGDMSAITKGAIMMFETENGLSVDGLPGPEVWTTLLADVAANKTNTEPLTYVLVTKNLSEHLTAWVNGGLDFSHVPVNTGVLGATTVDGTFQVFEHVTFSDMKGCNVTGSCYTDPHVPWASYFNGGDALHGYPRATYGWPQSNGCVEMRITTAGHLWPYTPIGTVVTVQGPTPRAAGTPAANRTTTTTTAPPPVTTTTATTTTAAPGG